MAMNPTTLAELIKTKHITNNSDFAGLSVSEQNAVRDALFKSIAEAVIEHIQIDAEVAFVAGQISGNDVPGGDSHSLLTASGGGIT